MSEPNNEPVLAPTPVSAEPPEPSITNAILPLMRLLPPPPVGTILAPPDPQGATNRGWFLTQLGAEVRLAAQMYFDPRYRISRLAQITFPLVIALMVLNYFFFTQMLDIHVFSPIAERLFDVVLAVLAYRVLTRELDRYRTVLDYLGHFSAR